MSKKIIFVLILLAIAVAGFIVYDFSPTPNILRNNTVEGIKLTATVPGDDRMPIIRTFTTEEYLKLSAKQIDKIDDRISGKLEGDIPCLSLNKETRLRFTFEKDGKIVSPEKISIKIKSHASHHDDPIKSREISDTLEKSKDGSYTYSFKRYHTQYEKYFLEFLRIELTYTIDEVPFTSVFSIFQGNANDGTDFFHNKTLETPVPSEVTL